MKKDNILDEAKELWNFQMEILNEISVNNQDKNLKYKHYPVNKAKKEFKQGLRKKYKVITINWTYNQDKEKVNYSEVHKNEYIWTLDYLLKWIFACYKDVAEDIISIEPLEKSKKGDSEMNLIKMQKGEIKPIKEKDNFEQIRKAIEKLIDKHKGNFCFIGSFFIFDNDSNVVDDRMFAYGPKENLKISLDSLNEELEKEKKEFINW